MKRTGIAILGLSVLCAHAYAANTTETSTTTTSVSAPAQNLTPAEKNKAAGDAFLAANKKKAGVTTLTDGLQYKVIKKGNGPIPTDIDIVKVNYAGKLIDGTEFDSSYSRGEPASFPVGGVIPGWTEALKMMPVGSTYELYIPAALAYGEEGAPPSIGPNETLIFKVELLGIVKS